jgi:general secretion pathway protein F
MQHFRYEGVLPDGSRTEGQLKCRDRREALQRLLSRSCHPLSLEANDDGNRSWERVFRRLFHRVRTAELAVFTRQLASLLKAGLPMAEALATLGQQCEQRRLTEITEDLGETLSREGHSLAEAMDDHPEVFSRVYRSLVRAGEEGGHLVDVLNDLSRYLMQSARLRGQVLGAFIYPVFLLLLGAAAVLVLMMFVIPRFQELFAGLGQALPAPTRGLIFVSDFLAAWWWAVLLVLAGGGILLGWLLRRPAVRKRLDGWLLHWPVLGKMFLRMEIARIARTLGALMHGGVSVLPALRITGQTVRNRAIQATFESMIAGVTVGETLATMVQKAAIFPTLMVNLIRTGEQTGELPSMLSELSDLYESESERAVSGAVKLLEPLLIITMGGVIAGIVAAVMLPVFQANAMVE